MGYCMHQTDAKFLIKKEVHTVALSAILTQEDKKFSYIGNMPIYDSLIEALEDWRWEVGVDKDTGDINNIYFIGEKYGDDLELFNLIAPCVEPGSYIRMMGEDGDMWQWRFDGEHCYEEFGTITWPNYDT